MSYLSNLALLAIAAHAAATRVPASEASLQRWDGLFEHYVPGKETRVFAEVITMLEHQEEDSFEEQWNLLVSKNKRQIAKSLEGTVEEDSLELPF